MPDVLKNTLKLAW